MDVRYHVLGPLEVWRDSRPVVLGGPKRRLLLAVLLINANRVVPVERLISEVWPDRAPASAHANIRTYISGLRSVLCGREDGSRLISRRGGGYQLNVGPEQLDLLAYEALVAAAESARSRTDPEAELAALTRAAGLWRGAPLGGVPDGPAVASFRVYLEERHATLVEDQARAMIGLGRHGQAIAAMRRHVAEHPLRERGHHLLILALHASGATAEALAAYREARDFLVRELGVEPGPELVQLHREVLRGAPAVSAGEESPERIRVTPAQLPADTSIFVGRDAELAELDVRLRTGSSPVVVIITGMPGVGKTALAVHWAHRMAERFPSGQLYVNLRGYSADPPVEPAASLASFLRALGVPDERLPRALDERAALYRSLLARRRMLILLDNAADAGQVRPLLPGAGGSVVVVTSRRDLAGLVALDGAHRLELGPLPAEDSITLLARVLGDRRVRAEAEGAAELARLCGHLPLALRIVAADLAGRPDRTCAEAAASLVADRFGRLAVAGDASAAVGASFDVSYRAQPVAARRLFRLLGLVPGPDISTTSAAALADLPVPDAAELLAGLASAHLVRPVTADRFALHDLLGAYAAERAEQEEDPEHRAAALDRLYGHYLVAVDSAARLLYPQVLRLPGSGQAGVAFTRDTDAMTWLDAERENLVAAVRRCATSGPWWAAVRIADGLRGYFSMRMRSVDWSTAAHAALGAAQADADAQGEASAYLSLAWLHHRLSDNAAAVDNGQKALECSQRAGWRVGEAAAHGLLGSVSVADGRLAVAAEHSRAALALNQALGNVGGEAVHLGNLCIIHFQLGDLADAFDCAVQAIDRYRQIGARAGEGLILTQLSQCQHGAGELRRAEAHVAEALPIFREVGDRIGEAQALQTLAMVRCDSGETTSARELGLASLAMSRELGHRRLEARALNTVGVVERRLGHHERAAQSHRDALRLSHEAGERYLEAEALLGLADVYLERGGYEYALAFAAQALAVAREAEYAVLQGHALTALAKIHLAAGHRDIARFHAERAVALYRRTGHRLGRARALAVLGEVTAHPTDPAPGSS